MIYKSILRPLLFACDPEQVHDALHGFGHVLQRFPFVLKSLETLYSPRISARLSQSVFGVDYAHPIGLAAGFDKNAQLLPLLHAMGFGFVEVGSISAQSSTGNPKPRLFRLPMDRAIINRMGLNNHGAAAIVPQLASPSLPVGVSIVKTHDPAILGEAALADFAQALAAVHGLGAYVALNISCPNTREGKTFEDPDSFAALLTILRKTEARCVNETGVAPRPWCVKVSPDIDLAQLTDLVAIGQAHGIRGWIASNTTPHREGLRTPASVLTAMGMGGLSGAPLKSASTPTLAHLYALTRHDPNVVLVGVGGIFTVEDAWEKITHGARLLQLYTGLVYEGPGLIKTLHTGLLQKLDEHGLKTIDEAVGLALR